jgi:small subunit ribosomal protein S13
LRGINYLAIKMEQKNTQKIEKYEERLVRILSEDIEGGMALYAGLTKIKGVSWGIANAVCKALNLEKNRKIGSLTPEEIKKISDFIKNPKIPTYLFNRRKDFETGDDRHLVGTDLELQKDLDIKRLKKIKSYRGVRHVAGLPVRGQRTRSHFRTNRKRGSGIKKKVVKREAPPQYQAKGKKK